MDLRSSVKLSVKRRYASLFAFVVAGLSFSLPGTGAQQPQRPTFKVESNLVVVDVTVRDRKGGLIRDLKRDSFTVFEDNVRQEIVTFSQEDIPAAEPQPAAVDKAPPAPIVNLSVITPSARRPEELRDKRLIILFFDLSSLSTEDLIRSIQTAGDFVTKKSTSHDLIAVARYSSTVELVQDLTNDREVLLKTLKQIDPTETGEAAEEEQTDEETSEDVFVPDSVQFNIFNTDRRLFALETLAKMYREFPERKSLIYFSGGVATTGVENQAQVRSTVDAANRGNMSIYTVDSRGLVAMPAGGDASRGSAAGRGMFSGTAVSRQVSNLANSQETLLTLAHDTGGDSLTDTNDLSPVFTKVVNDTQSYYVLGYYSTNPAQDGRFRKIRVQVDRPDVRVQNRAGYFASKLFSKLTQAERDRQLEEALNVDRPFSDLPFILQADYFKGEGPASLVPVSLQLAGESVQFQEKGDRREAQFEFLARVADPKGRVAGLARDTVQVRLPAQKAEKIRGGQILYNTGFQLRPGDYQLKFLIRDNRTGKLGSFEQKLAVPTLDGKSLQISSVVVGSRLVADEQNVRGVEHRGPGEQFRMFGVRRDPLVIEGKRIVPSIGNVFVNRQTLYVYFEVYGAAEESTGRKPDLETHLLILQGKSKVRESQAHRVSEWAKDERGTADVTVAVPLQGLKKGSYVLQIHLRDRVSETNLFRRLPVVIS